MQTMSGDHVFSIPSSIKGFAQEPDSNPNLKHSTATGVKRRRNLPGTPDPDAEVIALSPKTLMATNRFICEICNKGFQRDQNLQLHRRGHNLPWKLKQRTNKEVRKKVYVCPEKGCVHHNPARALGDLTGIKKHFSRKHGEKKWKCDKCSKKYAVQSDWKAHSKTCGTREYKCDCGTLFSRKDSFITHRAFCDALAEESARFSSATATDANFANTEAAQPNFHPGIAGISQFDGGFGPLYGGPAAGDSLLEEQQQQNPRLSLWLDQANSQITPIDIAVNSDAFSDHLVQMATPSMFTPSSMVNLGASKTTSPSSLSQPVVSLHSNSQNHHRKPTSEPMSATALLQKAAQMGSTASKPSLLANSFGVMNSSSPSSSRESSLNPLSQFRNELQQQDVHRQARIGGRPSLGSLTRDFLGMGGDEDGAAPFLPQELAKFASMDSAMGLSHFATTH
ncbi:zinc finger protein JACKDAW-like [Diospyros lotus]|uniref:zinc finger protein JACKDAW-like n=1 Tax=Diospyros lotus TaxID=55363 RepID=UPI002254096C|nr:zinc finger protein JACKDAW-like [Diospyros lotus]